MNDENRVKRDDESQTAYTLRLLREDQAAPFLAALDEVRAERDAAIGERDEAREDLQAMENTASFLAESRTHWNALAESAHADVDALLEAIAMFRHALDDEGGASTQALYDTANEIAAKREGQG